MSGLRNELPSWVRFFSAGPRRQEPIRIAALETLLNRRNLSAEERELAALLTVLIEKYEERYQIQTASTAAERVRHLVDAQDLKPADMLDIFRTKSVVSEVLSGKRELSKAHIKALAKRFKVSPKCLFS